MEIWKDVKGFEGCYQVSDLGSVKSLSRFVKNGRNANRVISERILKPGTVRGGYQQVVLNKQGMKCLNMRVHVLVWETFKGKRDKSKVIDHINNDPKDNRLTNLQEITPRENTSKDRNGYSSNYVGVSYYKRYKKWGSYIRINSKSKYLGYFNTELEAHRAYQNKLAEIIQEPHKI